MQGVFSHVKCFVIVGGRARRLNISQKNPSNIDVIYMSKDISNVCHLHNVLHISELLVRALKKTDLSMIHNKILWPNRSKIHHLYRSRALERACACVRNKKPSQMITVEQWLTSGLHTYYCAFAPFVSGAPPFVRCHHYPLSLSDVSMPNLRESRANSIFCERARG